jgi:hypothetical protein
MFRQYAWLTLYHRPAWFPDVYSCRCHSQEKDLPVIQPLCENNGGRDLTIYPPTAPDPYLGTNVWVSGLLYDLLPLELC